MPQTPEDLSEIIRKMAIDAAAQSKATLTDGALNHISRVPTPYRNEPSISVDLEKLR